ncbi:hypothetical protein BDU57DRAFT_321279 [Ampelomyces quisqualis]|uniref:Uncharacterized protein n=1 Tax=Ampelomyces quisqualis TaxID=50730 RepID=A0A6A5QG18_AMPQU|nr:hypothetical protein BDU57DRAFT_321279 [Ampelomyces quisqualis]
MCHWTLRVWECGDSYFTKHSPCSFDRAAHSSNLLLNPLHPSIRPVKQETNPSQSPAATTRSESRPKPLSKTANQDAKDHLRPPASTVHSNPHLPTLTLAAIPHRDVHSCEDAHVLGSPPESILPRNANTGKVIDGLSFSEIGSKSRFGDKTLVPEHRCTVFEVVLQSKEATMCPACARNPQRAKLPAHARRCMGPS